MLRLRNDLNILFMGLALLPLILFAPAANATRSETRFTNTNVLDVQLGELDAFLYHDNLTPRLVQVDLATHPKISQFANIDSSDDGFGKNACGLVAAAAAVGGEDWPPLVAEIANAAGDAYMPDAGIQPSKYVAALQQVFGAANVRPKNETTLAEMYQDLQAGYIVIVDLKVNSTTQVPSAAPPNFAHFARVLGMDATKREVYIENTLRGDPYWTLPMPDFFAAWDKPEVSASERPDPRNAEIVTRWLVLLDGAAINQ